MCKEVAIYRRNLPHIHPAGGTFFITFRLKDTLPVHILKRLLDERNKSLKGLAENLSESEYKKQKYNADKRFFKGYDAWLDRCENGPVWLKNPAIAQIVTNKMHDLDTERYHLIAYTVMSNHVHLVFRLIEKKNELQKGGKTKDYPLAATMKLLKGSTAHMCNQLLKRSGQFWHHESYDHYVRNEKELRRIIKYVINNPVKAGLVTHWREWPYSFVK